MMVLYVCKWNILPGKSEAYGEWALIATKKQFAVPGIKEFRAYRSVTGPHQVVVTYEFAGFSTWAGWMENETIQQVNQELRDYVTDYQVDLLGPSPIVPDPVRF